MDEKLFPEWVTGFIDGEGTFFIAIASNKTGIFPSCVFRIQIHLNYKDEEILKKIRDFFNCGSISYVRTRRIEKRSGNITDPSVRWTTNNINEIIGIIIPHFEKYPLQSKRRKDYGIWKNLVLELNKIRHLPTNHPTRIDFLKKVMTEREKMNKKGRRQWNKLRFKDIFNEDSESLKL